MYYCILKSRYTVTWESLCPWKKVFFILVLILKNRFLNDKFMSHAHIYVQHLYFDLKRKCEKSMYGKSFWGEQRRTKKLRKAMFEYMMSYP